MASGRRPGRRTRLIDKAAVVVGQSASPAAVPAPAPNYAGSRPRADPDGHHRTGAHDPGKPAGDGTGEFDVAPLARPPRLK